MRVNKNTRSCESVATPITSPNSSPSGNRHQLVSAAYRSLPLPTMVGFWVVGLFINSRPGKGMV